MLNDVKKFLNFTPKTCCLLLSISQEALREPRKFKLTTELSEVDRDLSTNTFENYKLL